MMLRIDSHQHFWIFDPVRDAWIDESMDAIRRDFLPEDLHPNLSDHQFDGSVAVQADQSEGETRFLLQKGQNHAFIKGVVGWIDFRADNIEEKLEGYKTEEKLCGFRHIAQSEPDDRFLVGPGFLRGLAYLKQYGFTYDILIFPQQLPAAIELVNKMPDQPFVLDHMAKPLIKEGKLEPWASLIKELADAENVNCKVSGIITEADHENWNGDQIKPYLDIVFEAFGADRIMFGSDWPVCLLAGSYGQVYRLIEDYTSDMDAGSRDKIFGGNAAEFYGIDYH